MKSQWEPLPSGGAGALHSAWNFDGAYEVDYLALVDLSRDRAWLFTMDQARELAQQKHASGTLRLYWYPDDAAVSGSPRRESDMAAFEIDSVVKGIKARKSVEPRG